MSPKKHSSHDDENPEPGPSPGGGSRASEMMKRAVTLGLGTLFLTEESLRGMVSDLKLPKEILGSVLDSANKTKNELIQSLSQDILKRITDKVDPLAFVQELLARNEIELSVRISVKPKPGQKREAASDPSVAPENEKKD